MQYSGTKIGRHLTLVRERAGLKQADLAKRLDLSQAVLSRIETGERPLSLQEAFAALEQIDSAEARSLANALKRSWRILPQPPLDHTEQDLLWEAETALRDLMELRDRPDETQLRLRRAFEYIAEIKRGSARLHKRDHTIVFIGSTGVGKSAALCRLLELEAVKEDNSRVPALEVGGGGTTVCEVHIRTGPQYGLLVEPRTERELRHDIDDLVDQSLGDGPEGGSPMAPDSQGIGNEVSRAIRNMAGLPLQRFKQSDGTRNVHDPLRDLAQDFPERGDLVIEIQSRMELHQRDRRDIWYDGACGKSPMVWLKETFSSINNGQNREFPLPKRIEVVTPPLPMDVPDLTLRYIDTKSIDRLAAREDLECHFDDPHTLVVLCSNFNNAPAAETRLLIERAQDAGHRNLKAHVAMVVLPRPGEALAMKDDVTSEPVQSVQEGYELKEDQISLALTPLRLDRIALSFFNTAQDSPKDLQRFLVARLRELRLSFKEQLQAVIAGARVLIDGHDEMKDVAQDVRQRMSAWVATHAKIDPVHTHIHDSLLAQIQVAYASTIRASIRRQGEWSHLSYDHHIGYGARRLAFAALGKSVTEFHSHCNSLLNNAQYAEAEELIEQARRVLDRSYEDLLRKVQLAAQSIFREICHSDPSFWREWLSEWTRGPGFKERVAETNRRWFVSEQPRRVEAQLITLIEREWKKALRAVLDLIPIENCSHPMPQTRPSELPVNLSAGQRIAAG